MKEADCTIFPPYKAFYFESMLFNSRHAVNSIGYLHKILSKLYEDNNDESHNGFYDERILNHAQNIIVQGAALSKYFWPIDAKYKKRGAWLRDLFSVDDQNPLKDRNVRDAIEHFDEKLDRYLKNGIVGFIFPRYVGISIEADGPKSHLFRAYYTDTGVFEVLGRKIEVTPLANEIIRIHELLEKLVK